MSGANIVHSGYGLRCEKLDKPLNLGWGLDNSAVLHWPGELPTGWLCDALDQIFIAAPQLSAVVLPWSEWCEEPQALTLFGQVQSDIIHRSAFWQLPLWLSSPANRASGKMVFDAEREIYFPQRPPRPQGEVYRRYDPRIRRMLSFRIADPVSDAERFTRWMNDPRVEYFWEQSGSLEVQIAYLERQLTSKHAFPLIGCFDDRPFSYFEIYWAAEDRIGRHYSWQPFDRGLHLLVGEQQWRGAHYVQSWLRGVTHYLLLNAIGLMQLKASTSGRDVYRRMGWSGEPTTSELKNPERNISMGAAYLNILETGPLAGIEDPKVLQYALVVSYANGAGALLRTFSSDRKKAISKINDLDADEFLDHVARNHPAPQAPRYIYKLEQALDAM